MSFSWDHWWLLTVTLVVVCGFLPQNFWEVAGTYQWYFVILWMQVQWWAYYEVLGTFKPYLMQKNLFELFALTGGRNTKSFSESACAQAQVLILSHLVKLSPIIFVILACATSGSYDYSYPDCRDFLLWHVENQTRQIIVFMYLIFQTVWETICFIFS